MTMLLRSLLAAAAVTALAATPASAEPMLAELKPCYVAAQEDQREYVLVDGTGFSARKEVDIYLDEIPQREAPTTGFDGELRGSVPAPFIEAGERPFTLRVTERENTAHSVTRTSRVTRLAVTQTPREAATRERVRFRGRGFTELAVPVYAHYVFAGKSQKTVRLGMPTGPCGVFSIKRRQFPFKNSPRRGLWTIQFDQKRVYDAKAAVNYRITVRVRKAVKPQRAPAR